ncbi:hypothetical protein Harman_41880 [Haloarcula mannanilytica]|uniref:Transposase n=1 Tax=Haloarcula mannanilytica TaxID=2509225 RepID=A0A4C2EUD7_9EURY|nr:hypothetical protein Harman_41880 [Haloarcula mannanilytica]
MDAVWRYGIAQTVSVDVSRTYQITRRRSGCTPRSGWRGRYAEWTQIALILFRVELEKSLWETEDYLNEMPGVLAVFDLNEVLH